MPTLNEQHVASARERLQHSRVEIFAMAHALKGDRGSESRARNDTGFPRSRIMRAVTGQRGRMALSGAVIALSVLRPGMAWRVVRFAPLLRPIFMRHVLPRLLGRR